MKNRLSWIGHRIRNRLVHGWYGTRGTVIPQVPTDLYQTALSLYSHAAGFAKNRRVLDLRAGVGFGSAALLEAGAQEYLGLETRPTCLRHARRRYEGECCRFASATAADELPGNPFDLVLAFNVLAEAEDFESLLAGVRGHLREDGLFLASVPPIGHRPALEDARRNPRIRSPFYAWYWLAILEGAFETVRVMRHLEPPGSRLNFASPLPSRVDPDSFLFEEVEIEAFRSHGGLGAIFHCRRPRKGLSKP